MPRIVCPLTTMSGADARRIIEGTMMLRYVVILLAVMCTSTHAFAQGESGERAVRRDLPIAEVPADAMAGARKAVPGVYFNSAETAWWKDEPVYRLKGSRFNEEWFVYVNIQGAVLHSSSDLRDRRGSRR